MNSKTTAETTKAREPLHPEEVVTPVFLLRHGHTSATEQGILYTDPTAELTEAGKAAGACPWALAAEAISRSFAFKQF